jgi:hypothetical protein
MSPDRDFRPDRGWKSKLNSHCATTDSSLTGVQHAAQCLSTDSRTMRLRARLPHHKQRFQCQARRQHSPCAPKRWSISSESTRSGHDCDKNSRWPFDRRRKSSQMAHAEVKRPQIRLVGDNLGQTLGQIAPLAVATAHRQTGRYWLVRRGRACSAGARATRFGRIVVVASLFDQRVQPRRPIAPMR